MSSTLGAYGLLLPDFVAKHRLLAGSDSWISWRHVVREGLVPERLTQSWSPEAALLRLTSGGAASIDRERTTTTLSLLGRPTDEALVHPHLALTAAVVAHWEGGISFHGGVVLVDGGAWVVLGEREDGKSSTLAWFALHGIDVLSDDLAVVHGTEVLAGPRCIDLRESAAEHFSAGDDIGVLGNRRRWRLPLPAVSAQAPLVGWLSLSWGSAVGIRRVSSKEKFARLADSQAFRMTEAPAQNWLQLMGLPMLELTRPKQWELLDTAMHRLLAEITPS